MVIYDNTDGDGGVTTPLKSMGYTCVGTDIRGGTNGRDILDSVDCFANPPQKGKGYDILTGNCPFSQKLRYWINCILSGLPYFILVPVEIISLVKMQSFLVSHHFDVYYMSPRPSFTREGSKKRVCIGVCVWIFGNWGAELQGTLTTRLISDTTIPTLCTNVFGDVSDISDDSDDEDIDDLTISIV